MTTPPPGSGYFPEVSISHPPADSPVPVCDVAGRNVIRNIRIVCTNDAIVSIHAVAYEGECPADDGPPEGSEVPIVPVDSTDELIECNIPEVEAGFGDYCVRIWVYYEGEDNPATDTRTFHGVDPAVDPTVGSCSGSGGGSGSGSGGGSGFGTADDVTTQQAVQAAQRQVKSSSCGVRSAKERAAAQHRTAKQRQKPGGRKDAGAMAQHADVEGATGSAAGNGPSGDEIGASAQTGTGGPEARGEAIYIHGPAEALVIAQAQRKYKVRFDPADFLGLDFFRSGALQLVDVELSYDATSSPYEAIWRSGDCCPAGMWTLRVWRPWGGSIAVAEVTMQRVAERVVRAPFVWESSRFLFISTTRFLPTFDMPATVPPLWTVPA